MSMSINEAIEKRLLERRAAEAARIQQQQLEAHKTARLEVIAHGAFRRFILDKCNVILSGPVNIHVKRIANENYTVVIPLKEGSIYVQIALLDQSGWEYKLDSDSDPVIHQIDDYRVTRNDNVYYHFQDFIDALVYATGA